MIALYNLRQTLLAILSLCVGILAFAVAWWFFDYASALVIRNFRGNLSPPAQTAIAWVCVASIAVTGYVRWCQGAGYTSFYESGLMPTAEPNSGVGLHVHTNANRIGAWTYLLGQLFLSGPLQILRAYDRLRTRIPNSPVLENELIALRDQLRARNCWRPISEFAGREQHIGYLTRLGLLEFSPRKGAVKAR